jgi:hypothetical protein
MIRENIKKGGGSECFNKFNNRPVLNKFLDLYNEVSLTKDKAKYILGLTKDSFNSYEFQQKTTNVFGSVNSIAINILHQNLPEIQNQIRNKKVV